MSVIDTIRVNGTDYEISGTQIQSDWEQTDTSAKDYIKNKPDIPEEYVLPQSTTDTLGGVKIDGTTINIDADGTIHSLGGVTVDTELSTTSENPVQNKVITVPLNSVTTRFNDVFGDPSVTPTINYVVKDSAGNEVLPPLHKDEYSTSSYVSALVFSTDASGNAYYIELYLPVLADITYYVARKSGGVACIVAHNSGSTVYGTNTYSLYYYIYSASGTLQSSGSSYVGKISTQSSYPGYDWVAYSISTTYSNSEYLKAWYLDEVQSGSYKQKASSSASTSTGEFTAFSTLNFTINGGSATQWEQLKNRVTTLENTALTELPIASTSTLGGVKVDGTTITATAEGVITSVGGSTQQQANWNEEDTTSVQYIQNKPDLQEVAVSSHSLNFGEAIATAKHTYSTSEQVVGTWIDNKPLYEKTFTLTVSSHSDTETIDLTSLNIETSFISNAYRIFTTTSNVSTVMGIYYASNDDYYLVRVNSSNQLQLDYAGGTASSLLCATIQYTKTTD